MKLIIGAHISMTKPLKYYYGAIKEMLEIDANALMIYTGSPQNAKRVDLEEMCIKEAKELIKQNNLDLSNFIVHAPYIINLATNKETNRKFGIEFFLEEIKRTAAFGIDKIVLHPGSSVNQNRDAAINFLCQSLNYILKQIECLNVFICLETMAGKVNEIGISFEEINQIIKNCNNHRLLGVCLDTCHIHDAGYDLNDADLILKNFDKIIGLERLKVIHINDSYNLKNSKKDRHANIGYGKIGFDNLLNFIYHSKLETIPKILETPYYAVNIIKNGKIKTVWKSPYKDEIKMIKKRKWKNVILPKSK